MAAVHFKKFEEDTDLANYVKGALLGLGEWVILTQAQIDASPLFKEKPSDKSVTPANITKHWLSLIGERGLAIDKEPPHQLQPPKGEALLYRYKDLMKLQPTAASAWAEDSKRPVFVAVVPAMTPLPLEKGIGLEHFHNIEVLNKVTIGHLPSKAGRKTQYSFCGYCGVWIQNMETCVNHIRGHLRLHLVCGGCFGHHADTHGMMSNHMNKCARVKNVKIQLKEEREQSVTQDTRSGGKKGTSK